MHFLGEPMPIPTVAIIGRPNVGKSSLLNALAGQRISIVEPTAGVTRDRVTTFIEKDGRYLELVDTGGYGLVDTSELTSHIENQIEQAIASANLVLFMVDIRDGLTPLDEKIARMLRTPQLKPVCVANKADNAKLFPHVAEFSKLGFGEFLCISATNNINKQILLERIFERLDQSQDSTPAKPAMKLAVVGKRNAGKSTLVNAIVGSQRVIVNEAPGTTRDAVDVRFERKGKTALIIDTAGIRKKSKISDSIEFYSYVRASEAVHRADVILFIIAAAVPIGRVDKKLARLINQEYKSCILVVNKWDIAKGQAETSDYEQYLTKTLPALKSEPIVFTVATKARNIDPLLDTAEELFELGNKKIATARINKALESITRKKSPAQRRQKTAKPKIFYATQVAVNPITILMFVNKPHLFDDRMMRYIAGNIKSTLDIEEVPLRLLLRARRK